MCCGMLTECELENKSKRPNVQKHTLNHTADELNKKKNKNKTLVCTYEIRVDGQVLVRVNEEKNVSNVGLKIQRI